MTPQRKILFVDDESLLLANLVIAAKNNGYEADSAADGLTALDLMKSNHYDLIVSGRIKTGHSGSVQNRPVSVV